VRVRHVLAAEHGRLRELRLASLAADPEAFGATHALARRAYEAAGFAVRGRTSRRLGSRTREELVMRRAL
jgi:hypothetical protein